MLGSCSCQPCWTGENCDIPINRYAADFTQDIFEVNVETLESDGTIIFQPEVRDNDKVEICGGDLSSCPCAEKYFSIRKGNEDALFTIDPNEGGIKITKGATLLEGQSYMLELGVRNKIGNDIDGKAVVVLRATGSSWPIDPINNLANPENTGYALHRVKRGVSAAPQNVTFTLIKVGPYNSTTQLWIGSRVKFQLDITFPTTPTDMLVELFTPDNDTTVMVLCDVNVVIGSGINITGSSAVTMDSKTPGSSLHDRAIINLGTVTVNKCDALAECTIVITYEALMVDDTVQNGSVYWVSAGAEYNNANEVWVGQASFATITDGLAVPSTPSFNFTGPTVFPIGSAAIFEVEMFLPYPSTTLTFDAFAPLNTSSVVSICSAKVKSIGTNFKCGFDESAINSSLYYGSTGLGNSIGHVNIGKVINKASRENPADNSTIVMQFIAQMYKDVSFVGQNYWLGAAFEMGTTQIWAGQLQVTAASAIDTTGMIAPVLSHTVNTNYNVDVDVPKTFLLSMVVPEHTTSTYNLTVQTEVINNLPTFQLCSISIVSVGGNMPCVIPAEKTTLYSSTVGASFSDKGIMSLGSISNLALSPGNATENTITFKIIVTPLTHAANTPSTNHIVSSKVTYGVGIDTTPDSVTLTVVGTTPVTELGNTTVPSFNMTYANGQENVNVGTATKVYYDITTNREVTYPLMNIEAIMPLGNTSAKLSICRAKMTFVGKNIPCVVPEWINSQFTYSSRYNDGRNDRAILNIPKVCNKLLSNDSDLVDLMRFEFDIKVEDHEDLADGTKEWISAGNMYSTTKIWVGQLAIYSKRPATIAPTTPPCIRLNRNSTLTSIPIGMPVIYSLIIKVAPGESLDLKLDVTSTNKGLSICGLRLKEAGENYPCVKKTVEATYIPFSGGGNTKASLNMSVVTNTGTQSVSCNNFFDGNSLIFEIIVKLSSDSTVVLEGSSFPFTVDITTATGGSKQTLNGNIVATYNTTGFDTTITESGHFSFNVGEIAGNDTDDPVAKGEGKRFIVDLVIPESTTQKISVSFITPVLTTGLIEICDAAVISVGSHFPCVDKEYISPTFQKRAGSLYNDIATIDLGYVCSSAVNTGIEANNMIKIEAVARVLPNAALNNGDGVYFHVTVNTNDAQIFVAQINMTVTDTFVEKQSTYLLNNDTILIVNTTTSPVSMKIGETVTFPLVMNVPAMSSSKLIVDTSLPINGTTVATVKDIRLVSTGKNIMCLYEDATKGITFTPVFNSTQNSCENDKGYVDFGIVTNAGLSYRKNNVGDGDNSINVAVDIVLNDNEATSNGTVFSFSFGAKLGNYIFITNQDIVVFRDGLEKPSLLSSAVYNNSLSTSTNIVIEVTLYHDNASSRAVAVNASVMFFLPPYLIMSNLVANASSYVPSFENGVVACQIDTLKLCDVISIILTLAPNTSMTVPEDILTDKTVLSYQTGTYMFPKTGSINTATEFFTSTIQQVNFSATVIKTDVCSDTLGMENGKIDDCQIFSSFEDNPARPSFHGRINGTSAWSPFKRGKLFANLRFFQVYFGNKTMITKILVQQGTGFTHYPTKLTLTYSDDGYAWQNGDIVTLVIPFTEAVVFPPRVVEARYVRIYITEDNANGSPPDVGVKFGFFGCSKSSDAPADICSVAPKKAFPTDYYDRSFGVGNGKVIVCDVNPKIKDSPHMCHSSTDGTTWKRLSSVVGSILGYDQTDNKWFGYANDQSTILMSLDAGETWNSVSRETYLASRDKATFLFAKRVPWLTTKLDNLSQPDLSYQISNWGATFNGMMQNSLGIWTPKVEWEKCCV